MIRKPHTHAHAHPFPALRERIALLRNLNPAQRIAAIESALAVCSAGEAELLAPVLLELAVSSPFEAHAPAVRRRVLFWPAQARIARSEKSGTDALAILAAHWSILPTTIRAAVAAAASGRWAQLLRAYAARRPTFSPAQFRSLSEAAAEVGDPALTALLPDALTHPESAPAAERAITLLALRVSADRFGPIMTGAAFGPAGDEPTDTPSFAASPALSDTPLQLPPPMTDRGPLRDAIARSLQTFPQHRRRGVLHAALLLLDGPGLRREDALAAWFHRAGGGTHSALIGLVRWSRSPVARVRALEWLAVDAWATAACDRLAKATTLHEHAAVIAAAHLLERPVRSTRAATVKVRAVRAPTGGMMIATGSAMPRPAQLLAMGPSIRRMAPRLLASLGADLATRKLAIEPLLADPEPAVRHAAVRATTQAGLAEFCLDPDAAVARSAYAAWSAGGTLTAAFSERPAAEQHRLRLVAALRESPHETIRAWSTQDVEYAAVSRWSSTTIAGRLAARRVLAADPAAVVDRLSTRIRRGVEADRTEAIMLARRLGIVSDLEDVLSIVVADPAQPPRVIASALAALGEAGLASAASIARACLPHGDGRVRANAVEVIERATPAADTAPNVLVELKADPHHRVRANAIRALIRHGGENAPGLRLSGGGDDLAESLASMLGDDREMHRLAAAWLAGRCGAASSRGRLGERWPELLARVEELARHDAHPQVRRRALAAAAAMTQSIRVRWSAPRGRDETEPSQARNAEVA